MKKIISVFLALIMVSAIPTVGFAKVDGETSGKGNSTEFKAKSYFLMCLDTGDVILKKNEFQRVSPASVTKIMSILLVCEALDAGKIKLNDVVTAGETAVSKGGSQIWLEVGEQMTVDELLKAVLIASANDACTALGEFVAGSDTAFVKMMNDKARELGLKDTNFENSTGLDDSVKNHYSCAHDLAIISREVMKHEIVKNYSTVWLDSLRGGQTELNNTNKLVKSYNGITGLKTGTTSNAGFCLSATATRDGMSLVAVVLGSETSEERFACASGLLDYGFANYSVVKTDINENEIGKTEVNFGVKKYIVPTFEKNSSVMVEKGSEALTYSYDIKKEISAPVKRGDIVGKVYIKCGKKTVSTIDLKSPDDVNKVSFSFIFTHMLKSI